VHVSKGTGGAVGGGEARKGKGAFGRRKRVVKETFQTPGSSKKGKMPGPHEEKKN